MGRQVATLRADETDPLPLEQGALDLRCPERPAPAQSALGVDDAVRGDVLRAAVERPADPPRRPSVPEQAGDRPVRGDAARRHPAHHVVHLLLERAHAAV